MNIRLHQVCLLSVVPNPHPLIFCHVSSIHSFDSLVACISYPFLLTLESFLLPLIRTAVTAIYDLPIAIAGTSSGFTYFSSPLETHRFYTVPVVAKHFTNCHDGFYAFMLLILHHPFHGHSSISADKLSVFPFLHPLSLQALSILCAINFPSSYRHSQSRDYHRPIVLILAIVRRYTNRLEPSPVAPAATVTYRFSLRSSFGGGGHSFYASHCYPLPAAVEMENTIQRSTFRLFCHSCSPKIGTQPCVFSSSPYPLCTSFAHSLL